MREIAGSQQRVQALGVRRQLVLRVVCNCRDGAAGGHRVDDQVGRVARLFSHAARGVILIRRHVGCARDGRFAQAGARLHGGHGRGRALLPLSQSSLWLTSSLVTSRSKYRAMDTSTLRTERTWLVP